MTPKRMLWAYESKVTNNGLFNRNNEHVWAAEHAHLFRITNNQRRWGFNVSIEMLSDKIIGPHEENLNVSRYLDFLENVIQNYLEI